MKKHINPALFEIFRVAIGNSPKEKAGEAVMGEADEGAIDETFGALPSDAAESIQTKLDLVGNALGGSTRYKRL